MGVFAHQGSGRKVADAGIEDEVLVEDILSRGVKLVADIVAAKAPGGCHDGGGGRSAVDVVRGGRDLQRLLLDEECDVFGGREVKVGALLLNVLVAE